MARILVTPRSLTGAGHPLVAALGAGGHEVVLAPAGRLPDEAELLRLVPGCEGWLAGVEPVSRAVIAAADRLRVISRNGVGTDNLPMPALRERGIRVRTADGANAAGVAELAIGLMLSGLRHIPAADAGIKAGLWPRRQGREIRGRTVGVIGCGAIGREVVRLALALGASVLAHDPFPPPGWPPGEAERFAWTTVPDLLARSEVVSLHCPPPEDGRPLIDAAALALVPAGTVLVNTARAGLVDEAAVLAALEAGRLGVYAADVFAEEPPRSLALACHRGVIATSHIGAFTRESVDRATSLAVANLVETLAGEAEVPRAR